MSLDNTLAGLRKKYGPESVFVSPDPRDMTKNVVWVYDTSGKLKGAGEAHALYLACDSFFGGHFGGVALNNDLYGVKPPAQCNSIIWPLPRCRRADRPRTAPWWSTTCFSRLPMAPRSCPPSTRRARSAGQPRRSQGTGDEEQ